MLNRNNPFLSEFLNLPSPILLPIIDVGVIPHTERTARENERADIVVEAGGADGFLVRGRRAGFFAQDEACPDPDRRGAEHECRSDGLAVIQAACGYALHGFPGQGGFGLCAHLRYRGDEDCRWHVTGVTSSFAALCAYKVCADIETSLDVFRVTDHVHVEDACFVQTVHDMLWRDSDGRHEELRP